MAANALDEYHIDSLDDDHPLVRFMAREFGYIRDEVLQTYPWHFASTRYLIAVDADAPAFGWNYAYTVPAGVIRVLPLRYMGTKDGARIDCELEGGKILTNVEGPLPIRAIQRVTNIARWQPLAARVFANRLAMVGATRVTGKMQYFEKCEKAYLKSMFEATDADSKERGPSELYDGAGLNSLSVRGYDASIEGDLYTG